jgi:hypothetical protein
LIPGFIAYLFLSFLIGFLKETIFMTIAVHAAGTVSQFNRLRRLICLGLIASLTAACSSTAQSNYDRASYSCARGDRYACRSLPSQAAQARAERENNSRNTALAVGAVAIGALAVGVAASRKHDDGRRREERREARRQGYRDGYANGYYDGYDDDW